MTAYLLSEFVDVADGQINSQDTEMIDLVRERAVKHALEKYSVDRPSEYTQDITGDSGKYYDLSSLTYWREGLSAVRQVELPAPTVASDQVPQVLSAPDWDDNYWDGTTRYLYLPNHSPPNTQVARVRYIGPYVWTVSSVTSSVEQEGHGFSANNYIINRSGTWSAVASIRTATHQVSAVADADNFTAKIFQVDIPEQDFYAICDMACSYICTQLAARYSAMGDSYVRSAYRETRYKTSEYAFRAQEFKELYESHIGIGDSLPGTGSWVSVGIPEHASLQRTWRRPIR